MARKPQPSKTAVEAYRRQAPRKGKSPVGGFSLDVGSPTAGRAGPPDPTPMLDFEDALFGEAGPMRPSPSEHDANLVDSIDPSELSDCATELLPAIERDIESKNSMDELLAKGIRSLGFDRKSDVRSDYMEGGSGVIHPMMAMATVDFAARAMREIFPATGPVKTRMVGEDEDPNKRRKAHRVKQYMNYQTTTECTEWRPSVDEMLMRIPVAGTAISKITQDHVLGRPRRENVGVMDFIAPLGTDSLERAPRYTHLMRFWDTEVREYMAEGVWKEIDLAPPSNDDDDSETVDATRAALGQEAHTATDARDLKRVFYESHVEWAFDSLDDEDEDEEPEPDTRVGSNVVVVRGSKADAKPKRPYVITIERRSRTIVAVRRNWSKGDPARTKIIPFVTRAMFPWNGIYGVGLWHLIGGLNTAATGAVRALLDSAMVNNMPGGLRLRGSKTTGGRVSVQPMSFTEIDGPPGVTDIRDIAMAMPFNPPSPTLFQLMEYIVQAGMSFASVATQELPDNTASMPVGTMYALIHEKGAVQSSVHERLHFAQAAELRLLHDLNGTYLEDTKTYRDFGGDMVAYRADFDGTVDVLPVSDPTVFSQMQRAAKAQAELQLAQSAKADGVNVDMRAAYINVAETLTMQNMDKILPEPEQAVPLDPVSEVGALLAGKPVQGFPGQAHQAHLEFLRATAMDPQYQPLMQQLMPKMQALAASHAALMRREEIEQAIGGPLPAPGAQVPPQMAAMIAQASAQAAQQIAQTRPPLPGGPDQQNQAQDQAALITANASMKLADAEMAKVQMQAHKTEVEAQVKQLEIMSEQQNIDAELKAKLAEIAAKLRADMQLARERVASAERIASARVAVDVAKERGRRMEPPPVPPGMNGSGGPPA